MIPSILLVMGVLSTSLDRVGAILMMSALARIRSSNRRTFLSARILMDTYATAIFVTNSLVKKVKFTTSTL